MSEQYYANMGIRKNPANYPECALLSIPATH